MEVLHEFRESTQSILTLEIPLFIRWDVVDRLLYTFQIRDKNITAWYINKTRFVRADSIWNTSTSYTFQTRLAITFADGKDASLQYAFNCLHVKMKDLSSHISLIANKTHLNVSFLDGARKPSLMTVFCVEELKVLI